MRSPSTAVHGIAPLNGGERAITQVQVQPKSTAHVYGASQGIKLKHLSPILVKKYIGLMVFMCLVVYVFGEWIAQIGFPTCSAHAPVMYVSMVSIPVMDRVLPMKHLAEELIQRGYRVSFALPEICRSWVSDVPGLEFISLGTMSISMPTYSIKTSASYLGIYPTYWSTLQHFTTFYKPMFHPLYEDYLEDPPTIVVIDRYTFAGIDICDLLQIPYIINNPFLLLDIDDPPSYVPAPFSQHPMETQTVWQRCTNGFYRLRFRLVSLAISIQLQKIRQELQIAPSPSLGYGERLVLTNTAFGLEYPRPLAPLYQMVGALRRLKNTSVGPDLDSWIQIAPSELKSIIFVDFGPDVLLSMDTIADMLMVFRQLECRVIWKISNEMHKKLNQDENSILNSFESWQVFFSPSISHAAVMAHPNVGFFVSSGSAFYLHEALCAGRPVLVIPFTAEQIEYVDRIVRAGAGVSIDPAQLNMDSLHFASNILLTNERFTKAAKRLGGLLDSTGGVKKAANVVLAIASRGTDALVPVRQLQPFHKTYLLDVYAVYGAVLCGVAVILRTLLSACFSVFHPKAHVDHVKLD